MITTTLLSVFIISTFAAVLAAIIVLADKFIANYGECTVTINTDKKFSLEGGVSLLESLIQEKVFIPSACGGKATCGYCKVKVLDGAGPLLPTEEPYLDKKERADSIRLSCQVKVRNDIDIYIPEELLSVQEFTCTCVDIKDMTYDIKQFRFKLEEPDTMNFIPGQYVQFFAPSVHGSEEVYRAYSIASNPIDKNHIELIIRLVPDGICTTYCFEHLKVGDTVKLNGPYGDFRLADTDAPILFIAGGSGMAPIKCMLHHMKNTNNQREAQYFFGGNTERDLFLINEIRKEFESSLNFKIIPVVATPQNGYIGEKGFVTHAVERNVKDAVNTEAYLCGSPGMIDACINVLTSLGMTENNVFYDKF